MDGVLFEEWVQELDRQFDSQGRKITLVVDNCPAQPEVTGLKAINLQFLPPTTTSCTQPKEQRDDCPDDDPVSPQSQYEIKDAIETLKKLTLFETDPKCDTLLSQMSDKINHGRLINRRQTKIMDFYEKD
ncbi:uncharacterized protein LOC130657751 [Hydractinia symbiolongicarpus]|uniref:uncharacterized protein LOC130657751 n=1 Tax=Hydractinia symbiolongicarpus TaxID=13093 RepID=UPI00254F5A2F|nr:uncharacterized protein LOC130657751 [Hydractinia symbiolongicarpus]